MAAGRLFGRVAPEMGDRQHLPHGMPEPGVHPTFYTDGEARIKDALRVYSRYVKPGDLVFDIGANEGEYTRFFHLLSARVVAVEPQDEIADLIDPRATVVRAAIGSQVGSMEMHISSCPYVSTLSDYTMAQTSAAGIYFYTGKRTVPVTTLDALIEEHGVPAFAKIDVEGWESEVFRGLSHAVPALSFEVHPYSPSETGSVMARLAELGDYDYLYADGMSFDLGPWPPKWQGIFGDVYATLRP